MEVIAKKTPQLAVIAFTCLIVGIWLIFGAIMSNLFPDENTPSYAVTIMLIALGAALCFAFIPLFISYCKTPKVIADYQNNTFYFSDFECTSQGILNADFKVTRNKAGTLIVYAKDGAHEYNNVADVELAFNKLALLILKSEDLIS